MRSLPLLLAALALPGCLTTRTLGRAVERSSRGLETVVDEAQERLVVRELPAEGEVVELAVSAAHRELEVERYELTETVTEGHAWKKGGRFGRDALWVLSAAAGWLGAFGVSWETDDGRTVQIGGLGGDARSWQGAASLGLALGGLGYGVQQTVATHRSSVGEPRSLGTEDVLVRSRDVATSPLAGAALAFGEGLAATTDPEGRATLSALQLPASSFAQGLGVRTADGAAAGLWQPGDDLRASLLVLPADWSSPFHSSLAQQVAGLAREAQEGGGAKALPTADLSTPEGVERALADLPAEQQASQAAAWLDELAPYAQAAREQRARIHLDWLRSSAKMARQSASTVGVALMADSYQSGDLLTPLFQPFDLFRQLPEEVRLDPGELGAPVLALSGRGPRVALLETGDCTVVADATLPEGRTRLGCHDANGVEHQVLVVADRDLHLSEARAWVIAGLLAEPVSPAGARTWLPTLVPLYAASLARDLEGQVSFTQVLDEERLKSSGVLGEIGG